MLNGSLVRLRPIEMNDLDRYFTWINDREVTRYLESRYPFSRLAEQEFLKQATLRTSPPDVIFAIETLEGRHIGSVGLHHMRGPDHKAELGIMIGDKDYWSHGYGTDAVRTVLRFGFDTLNLNRFSLRVYADNVRAIACYLKCGFVEEARLRRSRWQEGRYIDTLVMGVLAPEFRASSPGLERAKV